MNPTIVPISLTEYLEDICPKCTISGHGVTEQGVEGLIESNKPLEKVIFTVSTEDGGELFRWEAVPEERYQYRLDAAVEVSSRIQALSEGVYILDVSVELDSDVMCVTSLWSQMFTKGEVHLPGIP